MKNITDLQKLEKKTYLTYHGDGLWDLFLGLMLIAFGVMMAYDYIYMAWILPAVLIPSAVNIKKSFAQRRLGYVKFSQQRQASESRGRFGMLILFSLTFIAGLVAFYAFTGDAPWQTWVRDLGMIPFGAVISVAIAVVGLLYGIIRMVFYGSLILGAFIAGHILNSDPAVYFLFPGIIITVTGIIMLIRFLRKYPKAEEGPADGLG